MPGGTIRLWDLSFLQAAAIVDRKSRAEALLPLHEARDRFEREYILKALAAQQGNISRTAEVLGVERSNLYRKMRGFGIAPARASRGGGAGIAVVGPVSVREEAREFYALSENLFVGRQWDSCGPRSCIVHPRLWDGVTPRGVKSAV